MDRADDEYRTQAAFAYSGYREPSAPPPTREDCGQLERPCNRTTCPHNLQRDDEPEGRPGDGLNREHMPVRLRTLRPGQPSCSLDVAQAHLDGLTRRQVAELLDVGAPRVRQLENRGAVKQRVAHDVITLVQAYADRLPGGSIKVSVEPMRPPTGTTHSVLLVLTVEEAAIPSLATRLGVQRRRKSPSEEADESKNRRHGGADPVK